MQRKVRKEGEFETVGDDGRGYLVIEFREYLVTTMLDGTQQTIAGLQIFKLRNRQHVNRVDADNFLVVATGVKLRKHPR